MRKIKKSRLLKCLLHITTTLRIGEYFKWLVLIDDVYNNLIEWLV